MKSIVPLEYNPRNINTKHHSYIFFYYYSIYYEYILTESYGLGNVGVRIDAAPSPVCSIRLCVQYLCFYTFYFIINVLFYIIINVLFYYLYVLFYFIVLIGNSKTCSRWKTNHLIIKLIKND